HSGHRGIPHGSFCRSAGLIPWPRHHGYYNPSQDAAGNVVEFGDSCGGEACRVFRKCTHLEKRGGWK
ncbi:MAG: hypothetical protein ABSH08_20425, partial [Tepidisphaeraceae bacterium]